MDVRCRTLDNRTPRRRVLETIVVCGLTWILVSRTEVNITRHESLAIRRHSQIGSARSKPKIVTTTNVPVARVVAMVSRELLEVGIEFFFLLPLTKLLDQKEYGASEDRGTD